MQKLKQIFSRAFFAASIMEAESYKDAANIQVLRCVVREKRRSVSFERTVAFERMRISFVG